MISHEVRTLGNKKRKQKKEKLNRLVSKVVAIYRLPYGSELNGPACLSDGLSIRARFAT